MDSDRTRDKALARETRRAAFTLKQALTTWAEGADDPRAAALAHGLAGALVALARVLAVYAEDGQHVPGDSRTLPPPLHRPPPIG